MSDLNLSPSTQELADAIADASANALEPGKFGAVPVVIAGMTASGAALFAEGLIADYLGDTARAIIDAEKPMIAQFLNPRLADLGAELLAKLGSHGAS